MLKGGYKIIDLKETDLIVGQTKTLKGVYSKIENSYRKPFLVSGVVVAGVEKSDTFVNIITNGTLYEFEMYGLKITINENDEITTTSL